MSLWPHVFVADPEADRTYDVRHVDGRTVEVKTDYYDHTTTPNVFMEYASHDKPGGPWRTARDGVAMFAYLFPHPFPLLYVWDDVPGLVRALEQHFVPDSPEQRICNGAWAARGFLVDRTQLCRYAVATVRMVRADTEEETKQHRKVEGSPQLKS